MNDFLREGLKSLGHQVEDPCGSFYELRMRVLLEYECEHLMLYDPNGEAVETQVSSVVKAYLLALLWSPAHSVNYFVMNLAELFHSFNPLLEVRTS